MSKFISVNLKNENALMAHSDEGITITFDTGDNLPIECRYSDLTIFGYDPRCRIKKEKLIFSLCERLEELHLLIGTFLRDENVDIGCLFRGKFVTECEYGIDYLSREQRKEHYLPDLWTNIRYLNKKLGKRIFILDISVFIDNGLNQIPRNIICNRLKTIAEKLNIIILAFFICLSDCSKKTALNVANNLISLSFNKNYDIAPKRSKDEIIKIPDPNFKRYLINYFDTDGDGEISIAEALGIKEIHCKKQGIKSLKGIEAFENLVKLTCSFNDLCDLDISQLKKLTYLDCQHNRLIYLDLSGNKLLRICWCDHNVIERLDVSKNIELYKLNCQNNVLKTLNVRRNKKLFRLDCADNKLTSLNLTKNPELEQLRCFRNRLWKLDVSKNPLLQYLIADGNNLVSLDTSLNPDLISLFCAMNTLNSIDTSKNRKLRYLSCHDNNLTSLNVTNNKKLLILNIADNKPVG